MAAYNPRNNGGTAHLFGTTAKLPQMSRLSQPRPAELSPMVRPRTETAQPVQAPTFAQMQQEGQARPAAPVTPQTGSYATGSRGRRIVGATGPVVDIGRAQTPTPTPSNPFLDMIRNALTGAGTSPSRFDTDLYTRLRDAALGDIEADFSARQQMLDEEMARRGLSSSSIAAGRMGDLAGQQARARTNLETDLLARAAETQMQDRIARDQMMMQLAGIIAAMNTKDRDAFMRQLAGG